MRRRLGRDPYAASLGLADHADGPRRREMGDVDASPGGFGENDVTGDHDIFRRCGDTGYPQPGRDRAFVDRASLGERPVLAVVDDMAPGGGRGFQGLAHDPAVRDGAAVVREGDGSGRDEVGHVDEITAARGPRDRRDRQDIGQAGPPGLGQDLLGYLPAVVDGSSVGHGADRGEAAPNSRPGPREDRLLSFVARLPQMDVQVDEPGDDDQAACVDRSVGRRIDARPHGRDPAAVDKHIARGVEPLRRIDDAAAAEKDHRFPARPILTGSAMTISSLPSVSLSRTRTRSRWDVGRTLPT